MRIQILSYYIMNTKTNFFFLGMIICIASLCLLCKRMQKQVEKCNETLLAIQKETENMEKSFFYYMDKNADISLDSLGLYTFPQKETLIYRFSEDMCDECINQDLSELDKCQEEIGKCHVFIFPAYDQSRNNTVYLKNKLTRFRYKNTQTNLIGFPIHNETGLRQRYFAFIDNNGEIVSMFFPIKNEQKLTQSYFRLIKDKFKK